MLDYAGHKRNLSDFDTMGSFCLLNLSTLRFRNFKPPSSFAIIIIEDNCISVHEKYWFDNYKLNQEKGKFLWPGHHQWRKRFAASKFWIFSAFRDSIFYSEANAKASSWIWASFQGSSALVSPAAFSYNLHWFILIKCKKGSNNWGGESPLSQGQESLLVCWSQSSSNTNENEGPLQLSIVLGFTPPDRLGRVINYREHRRDEGWEEGIK